MLSVRTTRFTRRKLPHWEIEHGRYFITVRCADSLPQEAVSRIQSIHANLATIIPRSPEFVALERQLFRTLEKHLDAGVGSCPLRRPEAARVLVEEFAALAEWRIEVPHFTAMPNHWHALLVPAPDCMHSLSATMKRLKNRTAKRIRLAIGGHGPLWQREWFDRWIRDESEWTRCIAYIQNNPVTAGLVRECSQHPWTK